jgi:hypothetical protein
MILEIVVLGWFAMLFLVALGKWSGDGDNGLMWGIVVALCVPVLAAIISLANGLLGL